MSPNAAKVLLEEKKKLTELYERWRGIAIAYMVLCEKSGIHDKILPMLTEEDKALIRKELTVFMDKFAAMGSEKSE